MKTPLREVKRVFDLHASLYWDMHPHIESRDLYTNAAHRAKALRVVRAYQRCTKRLLAALDRLERRLLAAK